ncbi:MAG: 2-oxo acid dehydrogenase subunit E2 [Bacteroidetes bacterium]|jgi:2-oxoglutarate dehydrogenase E2 component (dihydrolipoamide succinyltransferase)|nr:2-oxo acid dehydrogenase subunit E2 [Bacteroidota bacterium]MBX7239510.1 2-oxo acid dehydrogenase subunit E2 [Bacteroidia bacterium]MCC7514341.1 2-oxo acid dehydrogenase subunit E2 [Bacteroidia bacterium]HCI57431.1 diapophytoene dehydrogenase [Bacteroidota bacterium]HMU78064.1 dihydrolipoamide acetyltransferase family protein [Bacteroidia bacterium]
MSQVELKMPKMGESVAEATITKWLKKEGDRVEQDEPILEIATDKVDSEVPSTAAGILVKQLYNEGDVVAVGKSIAIIGDSASSAAPTPSVPKAEEVKIAVAPVVATQSTTAATTAVSASSKFYSPLVRNIAQQENVSSAELDAIAGTGAEGRVTKKDILQFIENRKSGNGQIAQNTSAPAVQPATTPQPKAPAAIPVTDGDVEIIEMDRMRKLIADHMVMSKHTSPHVTSFVEADVTNMVLWRNKVKNDFEKREKEKITFTPLFIEAIVRAIKDYPMINCSLDGTKILLKKNINIGMATALPSGNLIVPVIKNADRMNLVGLTKSVNDLSGRARKNKLSPDEIAGGTFTLTNVGTFGNVMGTPIINQPQVAIMAAGAIRKKPAVIETEFGDTIGIRHMMFLSLSYDHRIVDGSLGGSFLRKVADYLEQFDVNRNLL